MSKQTITYNNYKFLIEYLNSDELIQIEVIDLTNPDSHYLTSIESHQVNIQPLNKFYKALVNGLTNKPNYFVTITPTNKNGVEKLVLDVKINYDEIIELTDSIHIPTKKSVLNDFDLKLNQLEQKLEIKVDEKLLGINNKLTSIEQKTKNQYTLKLQKIEKKLETKLEEIEKNYNAKLEELEVYYNKQLKNLIETNKMMNINNQVLIDRVNQMERDQFTVFGIPNGNSGISEIQLLNKNIDSCNLRECDVWNNGSSLRGFNISLNFIKMNINYNFSFNIIHCYKKNNQLTCSQQFTSLFGDFEDDFTSSKVLSNNKTVINENFIKEISKYMFLNLKKINISSDFRENQHKYEEMVGFLNLYLSNRQDHIVDEIQIKDNRFVEVLLKYKNYKKLLIKYDKDFNDNQIKTYCKTNDIQFDYVT